MTILAPLAGNVNGRSSGTMLGDIIGARTSQHPAAAASAAVAAAAALSGEQAVTFLKQLDENGRHNLLALDPHGGPSEGRTFEPSDWQAMADWITARNGRLNLYFSVNEPRAGAPHKKLDKADIVAVRALFADADPAKDADFVAERARLAALDQSLRAGPIPPSMSIDSGGGRQWFWKLDAKLPVDADTQQWAETYGRGLARMLDADAVQNIDRPMRLPGTLNLPDAKKRARGRVPAPAQLVHTATTTYSVAAIEKTVNPATARAAEHDERHVRETADIIATPDRTLTPELRARFEAARSRNSKLDALWRCDRSGLIGNDNSGSGWRASLARRLAEAGFDATDYVCLIEAWENPAVDLSKADDRQLARDWGRMGAPFTQQAKAEKWFEDPAEGEDRDFAKAPPAEPYVSIFPDDVGSAAGIFDVLSIEQLFERPDPRFTIARHIPEQSLGFLYGDPGTGKSFIALDWALHLAFGFPDWHGDAIDAADGMVIYIAGEGASGFKTRIAAWMQVRGVPEDKTSRFGLIFQSINFVRADEVQKLAATLRQRFAGRVALIVVDTVSRSIPGADENLQKDMTLFVDACGFLQREFGATVLGVHHANASGSMRGSGVLGGAGDFVFKFERKKGVSIGRLLCEKQKDAPDGWSEAYRMDLVHVGDEKTSLVPARSQITTSGPIKLTSDLSQRILGAMAEAWAAGQPWGATYRAKERWAAQRIKEDFALDHAEADNLIATWSGMGLIIEEIVDKKSKRKGFRVIGGAGASNEGSVFG